MIFLKQKIQEIRTIAENILYRSIHTYINHFFLRQKFQQGCGDYFYECQVTTCHQSLITLTSQAVIQSCNPTVGPFLRPAHKSNLHPQQPVTDQFAFSILKLSSQAAEKNKRRDINQSFLQPEQFIRSSVRYQHQQLRQIVFLISSSHPLLTPTIMDLMKTEFIKCC